MLSPRFLIRNNQLGTLWAIKLLDCRCAINIGRIRKSAICNEPAALNEITMNHKYYCLKGYCDYLRARCLLFLDKVLILRRKKSAVFSTKTYLE